MTQTRLAAVVAVLVPVLLAGCGGSSGTPGTTATQKRSPTANGTATPAQHAGGTLQVVSQSNPGSIDPAYGASFASFDVDHMTNDGLVAFRDTSGAAGERLVPDLATALPKVSDGGRLYTFRLRKGLTFSNGRPVKATDFLASMERLWRGNATSSYYSAIVGAKACSAHPAKCDLSAGIKADNATGKITIHLTKPDGVFLQTLAIPSGDILPAGLPTHDVGTKAVPATGPYMIVSYSPLKGVVLKRNPHFHQWSAEAQPAGYPDEINWVWGVSADDEVNGTQSGAYDWDYDVPAADRISAIATAHPNLVHVFAALNTFYLPLNTRAAPFNNLKARQALNFAVDRAAAVKLWGGSGIATPTCQILPPDQPGATPTYCPYTKNPGTTWSAPDMAKAKQLVAASGTKGDSVIVYAETVSPESEISQYVASVLTSLGYKVKLRSFNTGVYFSLAGNSKTNFSVSTNDWSPYYPDNSDYIDQLFGCDQLVLGSDANLNWSFYCNHALQQRIDTAMRYEDAHPLAGSAGAAELWHKANNLLTDQAPMLPLFNPKAVVLTSEHVGNLVYNPIWTVLPDQMWVR